MLSSKKNLHVKGLCGRCLLEFIDWRHSQSSWYFDPDLWTIEPLTFSLVRYPLPSLCQSTVYTDSACVTGGGGGEGGGCWVLLKTIFCRSLTLCTWPDLEPPKLLDLPQQKRRRGGGLRQAPYTALWPWWKQQNFLLSNCTLVVYNKKTVSRGLPSLVCTEEDGLSN
jgi:hypothetical protein